MTVVARCRVSLGKSLARRLVNVCALHVTSHESLGSGDNPPAYRTLAQLNHHPKGNILCRASLGASIVNRVSEMGSIELAGPE